VLSRRRFDERRLLLRVTQPTLGRRVTAEFLGAAMLLAAVVGSGLMADRLANGQPAMELLAVSITTGAALGVAILIFGPISGAHLNPAVTIVAAWRRTIAWSAVAPYVAGQIGGALCGVAIANLMFGVPAFSMSDHARTGFGQDLGEFVATFGLVATILGCARFKPGATPAAVGAYIVAALWFTSSTAFANPAVTIARTMTDSYTGIRALDVPAFIVAQFAGAIAAAALFGWLVPEPLEVPA
jgi:glycerol uptake facilitator-like aquaporin